jgi:hypothetical protein
VETGTLLEWSPFIKMNLTADQDRYLERCRQNFTGPSTKDEISLRGAERAPNQLLSFPWSRKQICSKEAVEENSEQEEEKTYWYKIQKNPNPGPPTTVQRHNNDVPPVALQTIKGLCEGSPGKT